MKTYSWQYGVTTVPERLDNLLPRTLASLELAGFDKPRIFVDGLESWDCNGLEVTCRHPRVRVAANWILSMWELYLRNPIADRYAIFQDDILVYRNLRQYLDNYKLPIASYWNLYVTPENEKRAREKTGWYMSNQMGRGALGLVFDRPGIVALLSSKRLTSHAQDAQRGWRRIDGAIMDAMRIEKRCEWVHYPTLVQHTGKEDSTIGNNEALPESWRGEDFDALELLTC